MASPATSIPLYLSTYVLFLTDLCSSGVLNYDKERAKLCSKAGIKDRNCTSSESILINEALRVAELEDDLAEANQELGDVRREKLNAEQYKVTLTARSRIEVVIRDLWPKGLRRPQSYKGSVIIILKSGTPASRALLEEVLSLYGRTNPEASINMFADAVEKIFGSTSGVGAHNVVDPEILMTFRNASDDTLVKMLALFKISHDAVYVNALRAISMRLPIPADGDSYEDLLDTYACVEIIPQNENRMFNHKKISIKEADIKEFFPTAEPKSVNFERDAKQNILSITVEFENTNAAVVAFNENYGWLKKIEVHVNIVSCPIPTSKPPNQPSQLSNQPTSR